MATRTGIGVGSLLLAIFIAAALARSAPKTEPTDREGAAPSVPVVVLHQVELARQWRGLGAVQAVENADIPARVSAVVVSIPDEIDPGARVAKGQLIAQLDPEDFERQAEIATQNVADLYARLAQLDVQQTRLEERRKLEEELLAINSAELQRVQKLFEDKAGTQQGVDRAKRTLIENERALSTTLEQLDSLEPQRGQLRAQLASQEASLKLAQLSLARSRIVSPIDGIIEVRDVEIGENLAPGQRVARVVGLSKVEVPLYVPASARTDLAIGDRVVLRSASRPDREWRAKVSRIFPVDDVVTRTTAYYAELDQPDAEARFGTPEGADLLIPGAFVTGMVSSNVGHKHWVVPRRSVRNGRVMLVQDGVIRSCEVDPDYTYEGQIPSMGIDDDQWVVLKDNAVPFQDGDQIVIDVSLALPEGARVESMPQNTGDHTVARDSGPPGPPQEAQR